MTILSRLRSWWASYRSRLAMQCKILPATLYNLEKSGKDFSVSTLIRLVRGTGAQWQDIGALLEKHYRD